MLMSNPLVGKFSHEQNEFERLANSCTQCCNEIRGTRLTVSTEQYHRHVSEWHSEEIRELSMLPSIGAA